MLFFYGGHLVMRSKRCAVQNQGITLRKLVPPMDCFDYEKIWKRRFKGHKNSELTCYRHNGLIFTENDALWNCSSIS